MPETLLVNDFKSGWCPSDDAVNGRPNALLKMDNLELDTNGALTLAGGTVVKQSGYSYPAHTIFSRYISGSRHDYLADTNGGIFRDTTSIASGGSTTNAAFGTAFNFTLACSGDKRVKDSGSGAAVNLGVTPASVKPTVSQSELNAPWAFIGDMQSNTVIPTGMGSVAVIGGGSYIQCTTNASGVFVLQKYPGSLQDCTTLSGVGTTGTSTDEDFVTLSGFMTSPYGVSIQFDVLLVTPDAAGDVVTDYYTFAVADISKQANFDSYTGAFTIRMARSDFNRVGGGAQNWSTVYGFRLTINTNATAVSVINIWGPYQGQANFVIQGGTSAQFGNYQWMQVNVNNTGSYLALSPLGPLTNVLTVQGNNALITAQAPTDPQVNEVWIFRSGGNLGGNWYRVIKLTSSFTTPTYDPLGDQLALALDIQYNVDLVSIASTSIADKIYDIVGPIQGRWYYFTSNFMYPSDINNPDLVNPRLAIRTCGSASEMFMWARAISASVVLVGTSLNVYLLTGTFTTFPDSSIDVYYQPEGISQYPPITYDAVVYQGAVYYLANDGWRICTATAFGTTYAGAKNDLIVAPNTDRLYRGESCYGYSAPNIKIAPGSVRFPVTIARNKLWCFITGAGRCEIYDFIRQYWRTSNYSLGDVTAVTNTQDGQVLAYYSSDNKTREISVLSSKLIDGTTQQTYTALFTYKDNGKPRQRKDTYTFKSRCYTGTSGTFQLLIFDENSNVKSVTGLGNSTSIGFNPTREISTDLSQAYNTILPKTYQVEIFGTSADFNMQDFSIDYDARPVPLSFLRIQPSNMGSPTKKRIRTIPMVMDTLNNNVVFTPNVDGVNQPPTTFNTGFKQTVYHFFNNDVFGIDYGGTLYDSSGLMEFWEMGTPNIVQNLPGPCLFDQIGPSELFRFGKLEKMELRVVSTTNTIPYKIYFSDSPKLTGNFNCTPNVDDSYFVDVPKGTSGRILRVELGPTATAFYRFYMRFWVATSGNEPNTELQVITIPNGVGSF